MFIHHRASNVTPPHDATPSPARKSKRKKTETEGFPTTVTNKSAIPPSTNDHHCVLSCDPSLVEMELKAFCLTGAKPPKYLKKHFATPLLKLFVDVEGDGNCLTYSLLLMFPDVLSDLAFKAFQRKEKREQKASVSDKDINSMHAPKNSIRLTLLIHEVRLQLQNFAETLVEKHKPNEIDEQYLYMEKLFIATTPTFEDQLPKKRGINKKIHKEYNGDHINEFKQNLIDKITPFDHEDEFYLHKDEEYIKACCPPEESYFLSAFSSTFCKTFIKDSLIPDTVTGDKNTDLPGQLNAKLKITFTPKGPLKEKIDGKFDFHHRSYIPGLCSFLETEEEGFTHFNYYSPNWKIQHVHPGHHFVFGEFKILKVFSNLMYKSLFKKGTTSFSTKASKVSSFGLTMRATKNQSLSYCQSTKT